VVYAPAGGAFTVDLSAVPASRRLAVQWLNPATGAEIKGNAVAGGSTRHAFTPPFAGDAVLFVADRAGDNLTGAH
jgi:hypothetical protein